MSEAYPKPADVVARCLPCPFCGTAPVVHPWVSDPRRLTIRCESVKCEPSPSVRLMSEDVAVEKWNTRA